MTRAEVLAIEIGTMLECSLGSDAGDFAAKIEVAMLVARIDDQQRDARVNVHVANFLSTGFVLSEIFPSRFHPNVRSIASAARPLGEGRPRRECSARQARRRRTSTSRTKNRPAKSTGTSQYWKLFPGDGRISTWIRQPFTVAASYREPKAALNWLGRAFGFEVTMAIEGPDDASDMCHYEMAIEGRGRIMIGGEWAEWTRSPASIGGVNTQTTHVDLTGDVDAHCEQARAAGATIAAEPEDQFYGDRTYRAVDHEGHIWTFSSHVRDVTRSEAEAAIGQKIEGTNWA